jgi:hypothetical protein
LSSAHFNNTGNIEEGSFNIDELNDRVDILVGRFYDQQGIIDDQFNDFVNFSPDDRASALFDVSQFGYYRTIQYNYESSDTNALISDIEYMHNFLEGIEQKISQPNTDRNNSSKSIGERIKCAIAVVKSILGDDFVVLPHFKIIVSKLSVLNSLETSNPLLDDVDTVLVDKNMAMENWVHDVSKVRDRIADLETLNMLGSCLTDELKLEYKPVQIPYDPLVEQLDKNRWMALEVNEENMKDDKLCLALHVYDDFISDLNADDDFCGILIDDWHEIIPFKEQSAGIAINYNQPDSQAPQAILLAVPSEQPDLNYPSAKHWSADDIQKMIEQTLNDAIIRSMDYDNLKDTQLGKFLPMTVFPVITFGCEGLALKGDDLFTNESGN